MSLDELLSAIRAAEVDTPSGFDDSPLEAEGGTTFDLPADVVVRPAVALAAADTSAQVYAYSGAMLFQSCRLIKESSPPFVVFVSGRMVKSPTKRLVGGALRLYSDAPEELPELAHDPSRTFAVVLDRYGLDYLVSEGQHTRFVPVVLIPRDKLDLTPPIPANRIFPEIAAALGLAEFAPQDVLLSFDVNIPTDGPVQILWPFVLDLHRYVSDVRDRRHR
jgi:hypothetical protein